MIPKAMAGRWITPSRALTTAILACAAQAALSQAADAQLAPPANGFTISNATNHNIQCTYNHGPRTFDYSTPINSDDAISINDADVSTLRLSCKGVSNDMVFDQFLNGDSYTIVDNRGGPELVESEE